MTLAIWLPAPSSAIPPASGFTRGIGLGVAGRDLASCSRQLILSPRPISAVSEASTLTLGAGRADRGRLELLVMSWLMFPPLWSSAMLWASGFTLHITAWVECQWWTRVTVGPETHVQFLFHSFQNWNMVLHTTSCYDWKIGLLWHHLSLPFEGFWICGKVIKDIFFVNHLFAC